MPRSRSGWILVLIYLAVCVWLIGTQGLFGESFIAIILGMPWSILFVFIFSLWETESAFAAYILALGPILVNLVVLYWIGWLLERPARE